MPSSGIAPIEARLAAIESKLGIIHGKPPLQKDDADKRLNELKSLYDATTDKAFREVCLESERLMKELDAGTALTHQTSSASTPLYYRRAEVLASASDLKRDMDQMDQMLHLLLVSQAPRDEGKGQAPLREEEITQAPIVNLPPPSREDERRIDLLQANVREMEDQAKGLCQRVDSLLKLYTSMIATSSRKIVMADEEIAAREQQK